MFRIWKIVICPKTKANEDKILKITKEPNRVIEDYSRTTRFLLSPIDVLFDKNRK